MAQNDGWQKSLSSLAFGGNEERDAKSGQKIGPHESHQGKKQPFVIR